MTIGNRSDILLFVLMRLVFCFFWIFIAGPFSLLSRPLDIEVSARSAILMNADTGAILYEKHPHVPAYPGSITKIATALFVLDKKNPDLGSLVTVSPEALKIKPVGKELECPPHWGEVDGTRMWLQKGEVLSIESLLHGLMLVSGNDAANALAESFSSSIPNFIEEMNQYIKNLGCSNTQFLNPHGLHHPEHFTTAYDICLIAKKALQIPKFREIVSKISYTKPKTNKQKALELNQLNPLMKPGKYYYPKAIGIKTGYHSAAMYTLVAAAEHDGRVLVAAILGCQKRTDRYADAIRLFEAAFKEKKESRSFFGPSQVFARQVQGGKEPLKASLNQDLALSFYPAEEPECKAFVQWNSVSLPIRKGQKVGEVHICDAKGTLLQKQDLFAREEVKSTFLFSLKSFFSRLFL